MGAFLLAFPVSFLFPSKASGHPEVTEMREKGEISAEPHLEYMRTKRKVKGTLGGKTVNGNVRERETEGELEIKYGLLDKLQLEIELEGVFNEREKMRFTHGDEQVEESEKVRGIGDLTLGFTYRILEEQEKGPRPMWVAGAGVKLPSAPSREAIEKEIEDGEVENPGRRGDAGEGNTNVIFRTAISKEFGRFEPFAELKYTLVGNRKTTEGKIEMGDLLQLTLGTDVEVVESLKLRGQFEYLHTGKERNLTETRVTTEDRDRYTLRGELI
jgi:hypothetical protein